MIGIQVGGVELDLGDANIRLEKINAMFITDFYQGDYSFPFTAPASEHNLRTLGFVNKIEENQKVVRLDADLYLFGSYYCACKLIINASTKKGISFNLAGGIKGLKNADKSLKEIDYDNDYVLGFSPGAIAYTASIISAEADWRKYGFTFVPHWNPDFYGPNNPAFQGMVNCVDCNNLGIRSNSSFTGNKYAIVPWLFLFYILDRVFRSEALTPTGTFWNDVEAQKILLYNNKALDAPDIVSSAYLITAFDSLHNQTSRVQFKKTTFNAFDNFATWSDTNLEWTINSNFYGTCVIDLDMRVYISNYLGYDGLFFTPRFAIRTTAGILATIELPIMPGTDQPLQYSLTMNISSANAGQKLWVEYLHNHVNIQNPYPYNVVKVYAGATALLVNQSNQGINNYSSFVKYKDHVNDIKVSDLLAEIKKLGVDMIFNFTDNTVTLNKISEYIQYPNAKDYTGRESKDFEMSFDTKNQGFTFSYDFGDDGYATDNFKSLNDLNFRGEYLLLTDLPATVSNGDLAYVKNTNQYYITQGASWNFYSDNYYPAVVGDGAIEITSKLAPMFMGYFNNEGGSPTENNALVPRIKIKATSDMFSMGNNDFPLRMCFYRGINTTNSVPSPRGKNYILASSTRYGINGNITGTYDLAPDNDNSFFATILKPWLEVLNNGEIIERDILLSPTDILAINPSQPIIIDSTGFFIKSISFTIAKKLKMSRFKMLKMTT